MKRLRVSLLVCLHSFALAAIAGPVGTGFTYQGRLLHDGAPLTGSFVLRVALFDAAIGGRQLGITQTLDPVQAVDGLFTVTLNSEGEFGYDAFSGQARWLEITIGDDTLSTRQPLSAVPFALYALGGPGSGAWEYNGSHISNTNPGRVGIGTSWPQATLHLAAESAATLRLEVDQAPPFDFVHAGERLDIAVDSHPLMSLTLDGNLGLGTTTPAARLEVDDGENGFIRIGGDLSFNGGDDSAFFFNNVGADTGRTSFVSDGQEHLSVLNNGNVGIGTNTPQTQLEIKKQVDGGLGPVLRLTGGGGEGAQTAIDFATYDPAPGDAPAGRIVATDTGDFSCNLDFQTKAPGSPTFGLATAMRIASDGNVGIGTETPNRPLTIQSPPLSTEWLQFRNALGVDRWHINNLDGGFNFVRSDNDASTLFLSPEGRVGIGTTNPTRQLHLYSNDGHPNGVLIENGFAADTPAPAAIIFSRPGIGGTSQSAAVGVDNTERDFFIMVNGADRLNIKQNGQVGIGTMPQDFLFEVNGSAGKPGGGAWSSFSDARLKRDITPLRGTLDRLLSLRGYEFNYTDEAIEKHLALPGRQIGLIAQEVEQVFPDWVGCGEDGYLHVTERATTALMAEALRDLRAEKDREIETLQAEHDRQLAARDKQLSNLAARISQLEDSLAK